MISSSKTDGFFIYKYVSKDDRIIYVGKSRSLLQRIKQHNSYNGVDEKFRKYEDADIYAHKCSSAHEMDALETLLIETYKPELNVACKTNTPLSFLFCPELKWESVKEIIGEEDSAEDKNKKQTSAHGNKRERSEHGIRSKRGREKFKNAVLKWHILFYFLNWLSEQDDADTRATVEFDIHDKDIDEWAWVFDEEIVEAAQPISPSLLLEAGHVEFVNLHYRHGFIALISSFQRHRGHVWIDLTDQVCKLRMIMASIKADLNRIRNEIAKYFIEDKFVEQCKIDGFYDFYEVINRGQVLPEYVIAERELFESERLIMDRKVGRNEVEHTSKKTDWSKCSEEELSHAFFSMFRARTEYIRFGGKYWNAYGADKLSSHFLQEAKS